MGALRAAAVWVWVAIMVTGGPGWAAELFVGPGEDYATLQAAVDAAAPGDTITIRGGYTTAGATVNIPNLTIRGQHYHDTNANNPDDLYELNPARIDAKESVVTSPITLRTQGGGNPDGTRIIGLFFNITSGGGSAVNFNATGGRAVTNVIIRNNRFRATTTSIGSWVGSGQNVHSGSYGWADGIVIAGNRMGDLFISNGSAMFPTGRNWTIKGNYVNHDADGLRSGQPGYDPLNTTYENGRRGFNINGVASHPTEHIVVVGNVFHDFGGVAGNSWALQPNGYVSGLIIADNAFDGSARDIATVPTGTHQLIAGNVFSNNRGGPSIDYQRGAVSNMVVRQNAIELNATTGGVSVIRALPNATATGHGMLIENNAIVLTGDAGGSGIARVAIMLGGFADFDRFDYFGPLIIRNNVLQDTGLTGGESAGIFYSAAGGRIDGGMNLNATNNRFSGLDYGVFVSADSTATNAGALPVGDIALLADNNVLNNVTGVHGGAGGAGIDITGSYFSGNTTITNGNVYGTPGVSPHPVAGLTPGYVTFRGDFNLDHAVDEADRLVWSSYYGTVGAAVTYFRGDATLDGAVSAADLLVWKRYTGVDINAPAPPPAPAVPPGVPLVRYDAYTGELRLADRGSEAWAILLHDGTAALQVLEADAGALGGDWVQAAFGGDGQAGRIEFVDATAGDGPLPDTSVAVARLQPGLAETDFGPVTFYTGTGSFQTSITWHPGGGLLFMLL